LNKEYLENIKLLKKISSLLTNINTETNKFVSFYDAIPKDKIPKETKQYINPKGSKENTLESCQELTKTNNL
jgi:uncharacterized protein (UPF0333 family)